MDMAFIDYLTRFGHVLFVITWIGLLYYFNFVQMSYLSIISKKVARVRLMAVNRRTSK